MKATHNVNDNVPLLRGITMTMLGGNMKANERATRVDNIADHLVRKFGAPNSRNFFCKCAWNLSEDEIWTAYEQAHRPKVNNALKYFITLCQIKMGR